MARGRGSGARRIDRLSRSLTPILTARPLAPHERLGSVPPPLSRRSPARVKGNLASRDAVPPRDSAQAGDCGAPPTSDMGHCRFRDSPCGRRGSRRPRSKILCTRRLVASAEAAGLLLHVRKAAGHDPADVVPDMVCALLVRTAGFEPALPSREEDFKSPASTVPPRPHVESSSPARRRAGTILRRLPAGLSARASLCPV